MTRSALQSVCHSQECPLACNNQHIGTHKFCFAATFALVCLFVCLFDVKQHVCRTETQNNAAFLAISYQNVIERVLRILVYKPRCHCVTIISYFEIFLLLGTA